MLFSLRQYNGKKDATFYIQCKGLHSGKPLMKPIPNCFSVYCADFHLFFLVLALYKGRRFEPLIHGSVVPFIRIKETENLIECHLATFTPEKYPLFEKLVSIDRLVKNLDEQKKVCAQLQVMFCSQLLRI